MTKRTQRLTWIIALACCVVTQAKSRPNIVFMLSDDQAWAGTSVPMHPDHDFSFNEDLHTPHLQEMADAGMRFSAAYAPAPVCSPTRASLITGRSPAALGWTKASPSLSARKNPKMLCPQSDRSLDNDIVTFAELLQDAGYRTAHLGKWHLDGGGPEANGFDVSDGNIGNEASGKYKAPNPVDLFGMAERAEAFMAESKKAEKPFFIQLSWLALHSPELNPIENLWHYLRSHHWSNRKYADYDALREAGCEAWQATCLNNDLIRSVCRVEYLANEN